MAAAIRKVVKVTPARLSRSDSYRLQLNLPKKANVAFLYNAMYAYSNLRQMRKIRNAVVEKAQLEIERQFAIQVEDPRFDEFLHDFLDQIVDAPFKKEVVDKWRKLGWKG